MTPYSCRLRKTIILIRRKWRINRKYGKKIRRNLAGWKLFANFAPAFERQCVAIRVQTLEGWVSGWNQQFAKLPYEFLVPGVRIPLLPPRFSTMYRWSIHLMVRIQDSQSWHRGSIPLSTTLWNLAFYNGIFFVGNRQMVDSSNG